MTSFNDWVIAKIARYLKTKEGFTVQTETETPSAISIEIQDTFGFRYKVTVETVGRVYSPGQSDNAEVYLEHHPRHK